jgi:glutamate dehydrogenase
MTAAAGPRRAARPPAAAVLLAAWRESLPAEEWRELDAISLAQSCAAQLRFGRRRRRGQPLLRLLYQPPRPTSPMHPTSPAHAPPRPPSAAKQMAAGSAVLELITEDMPFLVDTLQMAAAQAGLSIQLVIHPVLRVWRDASGRLLSLQPGTSGSGGGNGAGGDAGRAAGMRRARRPRPPLRESWQHLRLAPIGSETEARALLRSVHAALADLRYACRDWEPMRAAVLRLCAEIERRPAPLPAQNVSEGRALLQYMEANHFTFLGMQDYRLQRMGGALSLQPVRDSALGILRRRATRGSEGGTPSAANIRRALRSAELLVITKANVRSRVHRAGFLDYVGVKRFDAAGRIMGETRILGLWTSSAYAADPRQVPWLRLKLQRVIAHFPFTPDGHDGKRLVHILETLPRDELLQASVPQLIRCSRTVLALQERARVRLYLRRDEFRRFWSCLVFLPRERSSAEAEERIGALLRGALHGSSATSSLAVSEAPLAQLHVVVRVEAQAPAAQPDPARLERLIAAALVSWRDRLRAALAARFDETRALELERRYAGVFPASYRQDVDAQLAVEDIADLTLLEHAPELMQLRLYRPPRQRPERVHLRILRRGEPLAVSEVLPTFEHFGLRVIAERPYRLAWPDGPLWTQDFELEHYAGAPVALAEISAELIGAFRAVRAGQLDDDGFNRLLVAARLRARQVTVLRACCRYLLQTGIPFSQAYMERVLAGHPQTARELVELFEQRLAPLGGREAAVRARALELRVRRAIGAVDSADEDRILHAFLAVVLAALRTNHFVRASDGAPRAWLAIKLDPTRIPGLPAPRPAFEIFVHSPRVEGVHLRKGPIARGGIRWSERPEDFRTEILGLMKAQHVKNTLIVPVGAKGGFVARRLASRAARELVQREVTECYQIFIRALLDVTDNIVGSRVVAPPGVRRLDGDDPYLVVAADKGTASFSDLANAIAGEYGFWLGDAFASGGSAGFDHKKMGITARGAWECVKRHFRELGRDIQREPFTVAGIGDMSGDVFGNGMLQSRRIRLVAAFNHQHIFIDPTPDERRSFAERSRLFRLPRSSWDDYSRRVLSRGGAIYERSAKSVTLPREAQALLQLSQRRVTPIELMRAILCMRVDLLWNGGIGTYVKASSERNSEIGDRANDAVRLDGREVRARVVGEGGNLGFSQRGRIEYAAHGGRINADFIDNSAGVNTSDVEVNLKILLDAPDRRGPLPRTRRNRLLAAATPEVATLVVRNNYLQSQAISVLESRAVSDLGEHQRLLRWLERHGELDRAVEFLPDDEQLEERRKAGRGLTRPELALLVAYGKIALNHALTQAHGAEDPYLARELQRYFPEALRRRYAARIERHRLRAQIIITATTNSCVHRVGPTLLMECAEHSGANAAAVARAYTIARDSAELRELWTQIEAHDGRIAAQDQYQALWRSSRFLRHATLWLLTRRREYAAVGAAVAHLQPALRELVQLLPGALAGLDRTRYLEQLEHLRAQRFPAHLAERLAVLEPLQVGFDLCELMSSAQASARLVAHTHFGIGARLGLDWLHAAIERLTGTDEWLRAARARLQESARLSHLRLTAAALRVAPAPPAPAPARRGAHAAAARAGGAAGGRTVGHEAALQRWRSLLNDLRALPTVDVPALIVALEALEALANSRSHGLAGLL